MFRELSVIKKQSDNRVPTYFFYNINLPFHNQRGANKLWMFICRSSDILSLQTGGLVLYIINCYELVNYDIILSPDP
jgi:hypothetical protein